MIGIIDYRMGNLRSVQKALEVIDAQAVILRQPDELAGVQKLVLPGVGAFADGMAHLELLGWIDPIRKWIDSKRPFLGICLGMQLLFDGSEEDAPEPGQLVPGLSILPGRVLRLTQPTDGPRIKIPHMGWNRLLPTGREAALLDGIEPGAFVYFVHGYYCKPDDAQDIISMTQYPQGHPFCSAVRRWNVMATQFHPEKSQRVGLQILRNFTAM